MPKHTREEAVEYVAKILKGKPESEYGEVVKAGRKDGYHIYPLIMGLAKNKLGLGRKKRGPGRPKGRRPGRPAGSGMRGRPAMNGRGFAKELVRGLARMQDDAATMRSALREIAKLSARF